MTPKEKAKELVEKYYHLFSVELENTIANYEAKHCALIAVDEIIKEVGKLNVEVLHTEYGDKLTEINGEIRTNYNVFVMYWGEVKQEILSL